MDVKKEMESRVLNSCNNLDEDVNSIVVDVSHHLQLGNIETTDNTSTFKPKINYASRMIRKENRARAKIDTMLRERKWDLDSLMPKLKYMRYLNRYGYYGKITSKIQKLKEVLVNCGSSNSIKMKGANIKRLCHQINRCNNSKEERRILKEIERVEEIPIPEDVMTISLPWEWSSSWGIGTVTNPKEVLRQRIDRGLGTATNPKEVQRQQLEEGCKKLQSSSVLGRVRIAEEEKLKKEVEKAKNDIRSYRARLKKVNKNKAELYEYILRLEKQSDKKLPL